MNSISPGRAGAGRAASLFCAVFIAALAPWHARAACVTATAGNVWLNTALSTVETGTFTAYYDATPSASPINAFVGLSKGAPTDFTGFATLVRFSPSGRIDARNGDDYNAASVIKYSTGLTYHFRVAVNVAKRTYSIYVTPSGGSELTVGLNYAFRSEQSKVTQLNHWGVHVDPSNSGSLTVCNLNIGVPTAPVFSPAGGTYTGAQSVTIASTDATAIYYTTNGITPTTSSTLCVGAVSLPLGTTKLSAIAVNANGSSAVTSSTYILTPPPPLAPVFSPAGGTFTIIQLVTITSAGATAIYYTINGNATPTLYTGPLAIADTAVLQAIGVNSGGASPVTAANFTILPLPPLFNPAPGTYTNVTTLPMAMIDSNGVAIYYTTDGTTPTTASTQYSAVLSLPSGTTILKAIAVNANGSSAVTTGTYIIIPPPPQTPIFSPASGTYAGAQSVTITSTGATSVYYTINGNATPTLYTGPLTIANNAVLQAIGVNSGGNGPVGTASFTINLPPATTPVFSPAPGTYASAQNVTITTATSGATIRYTTDGSTPTETNGTIYSGPISISRSTMLKAIAYETGFTDSPVTGGLYTINSSPAVTLNVMHDFAAFNHGGYYPGAALVLGHDGTFYGTTQEGGGSNAGTVFMMTPAGVLTTLASFNGANGKTPLGLVQGHDGNFYGTTQLGGSSDNGTVFEMTPAGVLTTLVSFNGANGAGSAAPLVQGSDGNFYGTTYQGGSSNTGTVFKLTSSGGVWTLTTLVSFIGINGANPQAALVQGNDGNFYGTTSGGGSGNEGTVFKMTPTGVLTTLFSFTFTGFSNPTGFSPNGLIQGSDGDFYGTTSGGGGPSNAGSIFKITPAGVLTTLASFTGANGFEPLGLVQGSDGNFYGTTSYGGSYGGVGSVGDGTIFMMTPAGVLTTLVSFDGANGADLVAGLVQDSDGNFYGTADFGVSTQGVLFQLIVPPTAAAPVFSPAPGTYTSAQSVTITSATLGAIISYTTDGSTPTETTGTIYSGSVSIASSTMLKAIAYETGVADSPVTSGIYTINSLPTAVLNVLYNFTLSNNGGFYPITDLIQGSDGNFFGTTGDGGAGGTVFKMTPTGILTPLVSFNYANGSTPGGRLVQGSDGDFYGTTEGGDVYDDGTIFRMTPAGVLTTLFSFNGTNGHLPSGLVQGSDGNFYGATLNGGSNDEGTIFKMTPAGVLTTLFSFDGANGAYPGALMQGSDGNFYGTTEFFFGSNTNSGSVFKITPSGVLTTLASFNYTNGAEPGALVQGSDGNFYGTTALGGIGNDGTVFEMTPAGVLTTLFSFNGTSRTGPSMSLVQGNDGNFYGTTGGGSGNAGTIFEITPTGVLTTLVSFDSANGSGPGGLVQGSDGNFYGTTYSGGLYNQGVVFQLIVPSGL